MQKAVLSEEQARNQRLMDKSGQLLERALDYALQHLGQGSIEIKEVWKDGRTTRVKLGPIASLASVQALYKDVRQMLFDKSSNHFNTLGDDPILEQEAIQEDYSKLSHDELMERIRSYL
jgi:hypothetical protein